MLKDRMEIPGKPTGQQKAESPPVVAPESSGAQTPKAEAQPQSPLKKPVSSKKAWFLLLVITLGVAAILGAVFYKTRVPPPPPTSTPQVKPAFSLNLTSPGDGEVLSDNVLTVKGKTLPSATVVFYTEEDENSIQTDAEGNFEGTITLASGLNTLNVYAFAQNGEEKSLTLDVIYDDEAQVKGVETPPGQAGKEEKQKAVVGNIEKVTPNSVVVTEKKLNKRVEAQVDENTKITGKDKKTLKLEVLKLRDMAAIIATETATPEAKIKKAAKIFIKEATASAQSRRQAIHGVITNIEGELITLVHQIHRERIYSLLTNEETVIKIKGLTETTLADLEIGQRIAAVGDLNEEGILLAKRIHVIPGKATGIFEKSPISTPSAIPTPSEETTPTATPIITIEPTIEPSPTATTSPTP